MAGKNDAQIAQVKKVKEFKRQHKLYFFRLWLNHWLAEGELGSLAFLISAPAAFWFGLNAYFGEKDCISYTIIFGTIFLFLLTRKPVYKLIWRSGAKKGYWAVISKCLGNFYISYYDNSSLNQIIKLLKRGKASSVEQAIAIIEAKRNPPKKVEAKNEKSYLRRFIEWRKKQKKKDQEDIDRMVKEKLRQWNVEGMTDSIDRFWGTGKYQNTNNYYYEEKQAKKEAAYLEYYARKQEAYNRNSYQAKTARNRANAAAARAKQYR